MEIFMPSQTDSPEAFEEARLAAQRLASQRMPDWDQMSSSCWHAGPRKPGWVFSFKVLV